MGMAAQDTPPGSLQGWLVFTFVARCPQPGAHADTAVTGTSARITPERRIPCPGLLKNLERRRSLQNRFTLSAFC
jgi:hypothetical protein